MTALSIRSWVIPNQDGDADAQLQRQASCRRTSHIRMTDIHKRIADSFSAQGLMTTLGAKLTLVSEGEVHIALPFSEHLSQQHGYLHAGAITSIVDSACGYAALTKASAEPAAPATAPWRCAAARRTS